VLCALYVYPQIGSTTYVLLEMGKKSWLTHKILLRAFSCIILLPLHSPVTCENLAHFDICTWSTAGVFKMKQLWWNNAESILKEIFALWKTIYNSCKYSLPLYYYTLLYNFKIKLDAVSRDVARCRGCMLPALHSGLQFEFRLNLPRLLKEGAVVAY
jgi:hypothetical protein